MNIEKDKNEIQTVTALRNSWVVCKSKSHAGRIYYFNTLTGEAAWNLSDAEMEKASKRTKILESQPGSNLEFCPEPKDPPTDSVMTCKKDYSQEPNNYSSSFNKPIMKNQFPKQQLPNTSFLNTQCFNCTSHNVSDLNCVSMSTPSTFNPNIWTIPPNHQIVIAQTTPLIKQSQSSYEVAYSNLQHVPKHNKSMLHMRRGNLPYKQKNSSKNFRCNNVYNKFNHRKNFNYQQKKTQFFYNACVPSTSTDDLREKLAARRSTYGNFHERNNQVKGNYSFQNTYQQRSIEPKIQIIKPTAKELCPIDADDNWLKEHAYVDGTQLKLNVTPLKNIVMLDAKGCWYIVADSNTLLEHFKFINIIVNSDEQCQLMVPDDIMAELQMKSRSDDTQLMSLTHSVLQCLSHQFITGGAVIGKDSTNDSNNILDFTLKLAEQNHNVVLLSNYIEGNKEYNNIGIPIFTIQDIKELFETKSMLTNQSETCRLNITINNDIASANNFNDVTSQKETNDNDMNLGKHTLEMGVQTEFDFNEDKIEEPSAVSITKKSIDNNSIESSMQAKMVLHNTDSEGKIVNPSKRREIRLKRNVPQQLPNVAEGNKEKKQYKWRRRKNIVLDTPTESKEIKTDNTNAVVNGPNELTTFGNEETQNETSYCNRLDECNEIISENYDDNYSDTTSGPCFDYNAITKKTIVDETSTSGIISNTASNVDSESLHSLKQFVSTNVNNKCNSQDTNKCVMFEVENTIMEERLQMRTDEWLSRFVQIMEEILTQILCLNPPFNHRSLPPPWTLHEATECIKKKFIADSDITDAASKLTEIIYQNSNKRGVINARLKPSSFMEMYSYGVYLVDSLQTAIENCEDLQIAADSLAKLLADIQNADTYGGNNDSFNDNSEDPSANVTFCSSANSTEKGSICTSNITKTNLVVSDNRSGEDIANNAFTSYNLRSNQNNSKEKIESPPSVKFIRTIDKEKNFFSCLNLERKHSNYLSESVEKTVEENVIENTTDTASKATQNTREPKIIRQFNINEEFEERLRNKQREILDLEPLDYTEDEQDEYYDEEYDYDYYTDDNDLPEADTDQNSVRKLDDKDIIDDSKWVINKTINEVQHTLLQVRDFCHNTREELIASQPLSPERKQKIQEQAENARVHLNNLFESLNSVINREEKECGANILTILSDAGVSLDTNQAAEYRTVIGKRIEQGFFLLESINIVLEAVTCE